ncbi:MAG: hypothetical protein IIA33_02750 [Planctomycetes bacterium]|nr:hypothetical protein [Planctomycetota bacterium]
MAWIEQVDHQHASGLLEKIYLDAHKRAGRVFNILKVQSLNPPTLRASMGLYMQTTQAESPVSRALREMIATVVSKANECHY